MALAGLQGKIAVVTGGGSGIGAGVAARLAAEGAQVVVVDRDAERAARVAEETGGLGVEADVSREEGVARYMDAAAERFGRIDLYHLNAGIAGTPVPIPEIEAHEFDEVMAINVRGVFLGLREAFRQYERQGSGGAIVAHVVARRACSGLPTSSRTTSRSTPCSASPAAARSTARRAASA